MKRNSLPSPYELPPPAGGESWADMYPYYSVFSEERRQEDENRLWFWNSMHFPEPMPAFDVVAVDAPYCALGTWQNRVFAIPPATGMDYRIINGYVYISPNAVTDPTQIAERAAYFEERAGYYFTNWTDLYAKWRMKIDRLIADLTAMRLPTLAKYETDDVVYSQRDTSFHELLATWNQVLRMHERMWQYHFELLLLGYGAYLTLADFLKAELPEMPDQHIAQMVTGIDVLLFRPDEELRRLARRALELGVQGTFSLPGGPATVTATLATSDAGRQWLQDLEAVKDPWFNMGSGDGFYHHHRSWFDDPAVPFAAIAGHIAALADGADIDPPKALLAAERDRLADGYREILPKEKEGAYVELLSLARLVFPYVEEHKFFCEYWFQSRFFNKVREFGGLLAQHHFIEDAEDVFHLTRHEVGEALEELCLTWAHGGPPRGPTYWPPLIARRKSTLEALRGWAPPPSVGAIPSEPIQDPISVMLWGITPERLRGWAAGSGSDASTLSGTAASPGVVEGPARVIGGADDILQVQSGEILVSTVTSPAWAPLFSKVAGVVTDIGGIMSHAAIVCREYGLPAVVGTGSATTQLHTGQRVRVDGSNGLVTVL